MGKGSGWGYRDDWPFQTKTYNALFASKKRIIAIKKAVSRVFFIKYHPVSLARPGGPPRHPGGFPTTQGLA
ncbi:MAG TPA: hypothetical protein DCY27_08860 [Desulfobacterales bacterium]|nr:hypothetical protein [Desulfobacterales bacterium]